MDKRTLAAIDEAYLEQQVLGTAKEQGWLAHHIRDSRRVLMGDAGFPDWVFARAGRIVIAELKRQDGQLDSRQKLWLHELGHGGEPQAEVHVWRPSDWDDRSIKQVLGEQ